MFSRGGFQFFDERACDLQEIEVQLEAKLLVEMIGWIHSSLITSMDVDRLHVIGKHFIDPASFLPYHSRLMLEITGYWNAGILQNPYTGKGNKEEYLYNIGFAEVRRIASEMPAEEKLDNSQGG